MAFNSIWTVLNLSTVSESTIRGWISAAQIPSCIKFIFATEPISDLWYIGNWYGGSMPMPVNPWTIAISSNEDPRFNWNGIYGLGTGDPVNTCSIRFDPSNTNDTTAERGARMWHEMLHCMGAPADNMKTSEFAGFSQYLIDTNSPHQDFITNTDSYDAQSIKHTELLIEYYTYLTHKYLSCGCYGVGCGSGNGGWKWTNETLLLAGAGIVAIILLLR